MSRSGPYRLVIAPSARRALAQGLPEAIARAAFELTSGALLENPHRLGKPLGPPFERELAARRGTYRVIYAIDEKANSVTVLDIAARSDAYRPR